MTNAERATRLLEKWRGKSRAKSWWICSPTRLVKTWTVGLSGSAYRDYVEVDHVDPLVAANDAIKGFGK